MAGKAGRFAGTAGNINAGGTANGGVAPGSAGSSGVGATDNFGGASGSFASAGDGSGGTAVEAGGSASIGGTLNNAGATNEGGAVQGGTAGGQGIAGASTVGGSAGIGGGTGGVGGLLDYPPSVLTNIDCLTLLQINMCDDEVASLQISDVAAPVAEECGGRATVDLSGGNIADGTYVMAKAKSQASLCTNFVASLTVRIKNRCYIAVGNQGTFRSFGYIESHTAVWPPVGSLGTRALCASGQYPIELSQIWLSPTPTTFWTNFRVETGGLSIFNKTESGSGGGFLLSLTKVLSP
jgi:hypothetical protein